MQVTLQGLKLSTFSELILKLNVLESVKPPSTEFGEGAEQVSTVAVFVHCGIDVHHHGARAQQSVLLGPPQSQVMTVHLGGIKQNKDYSSSRSVTKKLLPCLWLRSKDRLISALYSNHRWICVELSVHLLPESVRRSVCESHSDGAVHERTTGGHYSTLLHRKIG